jgi:hypothetical protein
MRADFARANEMTVEELCFGQISSWLLDLPKRVTIYISICFSYRHSARLSEPVALRPGMTGARSRESDCLPDGRNQRVPDLGAPPTEDAPWPFSGCRARVH